jgi:hypothetical protein
MNSASLSGKCGACRRWVTNGLICNTCNCCFHINCTSTNPNMGEDCMSCKYQKHIKYQEGKIRYLELELKVARDEVNVLKNRNMSNKIRDKDNANNIWLKPKNSKSRAHRFSANDVSHIRLSNKFSIQEVDQQSQGLLKHEDMKVKSPTGK